MMGTTEMCGTANEFDTVKQMESRWASGKFDIRLMNFSKDGSYHLDHRRMLDECGGAVVSDRLN